MDANEVKGRIEDLVDDFETELESYKQSDYNETEVRNDFIDPFFEALGWDVDNRSSRPRHIREVKREASVEDGESVRKPDYEFRDEEGERKFFVEAKKPSVSLENPDPPLQTRRYGWNANLPISILTNFEQLVIYDCRPMPEEGERPHVGRIETYHYSEYADRIDDLLDILSREAITSGRFDEEFAEPSDHRETKTFDDVFLEQLEEWREEIAQNVIKNNPDISEKELNYFVHRLLNRIIFLRISEDRHHEPYEKLKEIEDITYEKLYSIFQEADDKYNSKLFKLITDYGADDLNIDADVLASILEELYYPKSPYTFAVIESHIIGKIYDLFLGKSLTIQEGELQIKHKPEVEYSQGVVTTPKFIVNEIVEETISSRIEGKQPAELEKFTIADICAGSGVFLTEAYENLLDHYLEWYIHNDPESRATTYRLGDEWRLTLAERRRIAEDHIFGVDIDELAVEVARFSLLLKILEDQPKATLDQYVDRHGTPILPDLSENIKNGNSLVNEDFFDEVRGQSNEESILEDVNPFDFESQFPEFEENNGFSVILGNPPYVRIQNMVDYLREEEMAFYEESGYLTAQEHNYDRYSIFVERALELLQSQGSMGYIIPQKFLTLQSGKNLRKLISDGNHLRKLVHFGAEQVFDNHSTYTSLIFLENRTQNQFTVEKVDNIQNWQNIGDSETITGDQDELSEDAWSFVGDAVNDLFDRVKDEHKYALDDVSNIFVGAQTSCNLLFEINRNYEENDDYVVFEGPNGEERKIEKGILRPYFHTTNRFKPTIVPMTRLQPNGYIIYPYDETGEIIPEDVMESEYPKALEYFEYYRDKEVCAKRRRTLEERDLYDEDSEFYRYGRYQSIGKFEGEKLIVQVLSKEPRYGLEKSDVVVTGGGNGPFYNVRANQDLQQKIDDDDEYVTPVDNRYLMAVLSHPLIEAMVRSGSSFFRDAYYSHGKQFIKDIPVKMICEDDEEEIKTYNQILSLIDERMETHETLQKASTEKRRQILSQKLDHLRSRIIDNVSDLYGLSEEEVEIAKTV